MARREQVDGQQVDPGGGGGGAARQQRHDSLQAREKLRLPGAQALLQRAGHHQLQRVWLPAKHLRDEEAGGSRVACGPASAWVSGVCDGGRASSTP